MSLIDAMMTPCCLVEKTEVSDGEGGTMTEWTEGKAFDAAVILENSTVATIADAIKETKTHTITVKNNTALKYGDIVKRLSDGATFKVTSESADRTAPPTSSLEISQVTAERWELTT